MRKSAYFSDLAFAFCVSFLPMLCFLRFRKVPLLGAILVATLFAVGICLALSVWMRRRYRNRALKADEARETERLALHLALLSPAEQAEFFLERSSAFFDEPCGLQTQDGNYFLCTESVFACCKFRASPLSADDTLPVLSRRANGKPLLLCNALSPEGNTFAKRFGLQVLAVEEIYLRLKDADALPKAYKSEAAFARRKKLSLTGWLLKRNARPFFTSGALVLCLSLVSPFPYYYLVMGLLLTATAVLVKVFGRSA
jgi:hypothetical protein